MAFEVCVQQARKAIDSAYIEATTNANCIGLVKLMGWALGLMGKQEPIGSLSRGLALTVDVASPG